MVLVLESMTSQTPRNEPQSSGSNHCIPGAFDCKLLFRFYSSLRSKGERNSRYICHLVQGNPNLFFVPFLPPAVSKYQQSLVCLTIKLTIDTSVAVRYKKQEKTIGELIKEKRQETELSLREASIRAGISHTHISTSKGGSSTPLRTGDKATSNS